MTSSETSVTNLLYRYAEYMDSGDLEGAAALFRHARIRSLDGELDESGILAFWRERVIIYADGTPRTKHVITNPIVEVDERAGTASCRSYYTVFQKVSDLPIRAVICGRYHDEFERVGGIWRFTYRDYSLADLPGDLSLHCRGWNGSGFSPLHDSEGEGLDRAGVP